MTTGKIAKVCSWFERMNTNVERAINLSNRLSPESFIESHDLFWALVKYAENVQECAVQLDNMKLSILESLEEVPIRSENGEDLTWSNLKKMRNKLAHSFWDINRCILWVTVKKDFPALQTLLSRLVIGRSTIDPDSPAFEITKRDLKGLPLSEPADVFTLGNSLVLISFDKDLKPLCFRISKQSETSFWVRQPGDFEGQAILMSVSNGIRHEYRGRRLKN